MRLRVRDAVAIQVLFVLFGVVIASFFPFLSLFLNDKGLTAAQIGVVIAAMALARMLLNPVWGHLADTTIGRRSALLIGTTGGAVAAIALLLAQAYVAVVAVGFVFAAFSTTTGPNIDVLALEHLGDERMTDYGRIRGWESLSYAVSCLVLGAVLEQTGVSWTMTIYAAASVAVVVWTLLTIPADRPERTREHGRLGSVGAVFREAPRFWGFLAAVLLVWTGFNAAWNFLGLKIEEGGGGPLLLGIGTALGGLMEVPVMRLSSRWGKRFGLRPVYVAGCTVYAFGFLLWGLVSDPTIVSLLTVFEGLGFGLLFSTGVVIIGRMLPSSLYSTGQSLSATVGFGVAPILGAGLGGLVYDRFGSTTLYVGASLLALGGALVGWVALSPEPLSAPRPEISEPEVPAPDVGPVP
jgi:MFS transporter, PPP family, 3-phenylpropionic acid transporter